MIYQLLFLAPLEWHHSVPILDQTAAIYSSGITKTVTSIDRLVFRFKGEWVPVGSTGDTSFAWAQLRVFLLLSVTGALVWTLFSRNKNRPVWWMYWASLFGRYYLALCCIGYALIKMACLQMPFPSLSQMATPLGDFSSMRLLWVFIGASPPYQVFLGCMELLAAILLFNRKTVTSGLLLAFTLFANISLLNLAYDVGVKIFSLHLLAICLLLLGRDHKRLAAFLILNKPAGISKAYEFPEPAAFPNTFRKYIKIFLILLAFLQPVLEYRELFLRNRRRTDASIFGKARYEVESFTIYGPDKVAIDKEAWKDIIFDDATSGSVSAADTAFTSQYGRGYFSFEADSSKKILTLRGFRKDASVLYSFQYQKADSARYRLQQINGRDTLVIMIRRDPHHYSLNQKSFHWMMEAVK
ncbi:MAG TPA: hypothetical protein VHK91_07575 [Flavisolibacter sp.]|jgi:hypothetical protein|nr:hypothetical protein [Flavisolibacter sp.]